MQTATSYIDHVKKSWRFLATWGILWVLTLSYKIQWDLSSWKQSICLLLLATGIIQSFIYIWVPHDSAIANKKSGLYFLEALRAKAKRTWILFLIPLILLVIAYLVRDHFIVCAFFIGGACSIGFSLSFGKMVRR